MPKLTLSDVTNLGGNPISAQQVINTNSDRIEAAMEKTLSRDGSTPNQMESDFDMNHYDILNAAEIHGDVLFINGVKIEGAAAWISSPGVPSVVVGKDGDYYLDELTGDVYGPKQGSWGSPTANIKGLQGIQGPQGAQGPQGIQGIQGQTGPQGSQGPRGLQGIQGIQGEQGPQGPQGIQGDTGAQGPTGAQGIKGDSFSPNAVGLASDRSLYDAEPQNFSFLDTENGFLYFKKSNTSGDWTSGVAFTAGPQGPVGPQGPQGIQGDTGAQGIQGIQGEQGLQGPEGPQGDQGIQGVEGPQGIQGPAGAGVAPGGTSGQILTKNSAADFDTSWKDPVGESSVDIATRSLITTSSLDSSLTYIRTAGYSNPGDRGGALYKRVLAEPTHAGKVQSLDGAWWELSEARPSVCMFGVIGSGLDESAALNSAIAYCAERRLRELYVPSLMVVKAESIINGNGVLLSGDGVVNAGNVKYNARSDEHEPWVDGLEYLWVAHKILSTPNSLHKTLLVGDSTVYGAYIGMAPDNRLPIEHQPHSILYRLGIEHGVGWHQVFNAGVNGTTVADLDTSLVTGDMTINTLVIKYMINDASFPPDGDAVETFATNLRSKLSTIRAARGVGGANGLSIILVSGNSANSNGAVPERGNQWFEKAIPVLRRAARDFQCCFIDVYSPMRDNKNAAGWMDTTDGGSNHTHPGDIMQYWIWGRVADALFNRNTMNRLSRPTSLTLSNGWGALAGYGSPAVSRSAGLCTVQGVIAGGTATAGTLITTLPTGSWPFEDLIIPALTSTGSSCALRVSSSNGWVTFLTEGSPTWTALNFSYRIG